MISIIVPVYNVERYIDRFLQSVQDQTYYDYELILVNDGSTDRSAEICRQYAKENSSITVIDKANGGQGSARNLGMKKAKGEWVMFADSDDYLHSRMLELMLANSKDTDIVMCDFEDVNEGEQRDTSEVIGDYEVKHKTGKEVCIELCSRKGIHHLVCWGKLIKKDLLYGVEFPEDKYREDEFFEHRLLSKVKRFTEITAKLYYYVHRENSTMSNVNIRMHTNCLEALDERLVYLKDIDECIESIKHRYRFEAILGSKNLYLHYKANSKADIKDFLELFNARVKIFDPTPNKYDRLYYFLIKLNIYPINKWIAMNDFEPIQLLLGKMKRSI